jgi:hypothetical protein
MRVRISRTKSGRNGIREEGAIRCALAILAVLEELEIYRVDVSPSNLAFLN